MKKKKKNVETQKDNANSYVIGVRRCYLFHQDILLRDDIYIVFQFAPTVCSNLKSFKHLSKAYLA